MAKIVISATSNVNWTKEKYIDSFVQGMINALVRSGNDVLNIRANDFIVRNISLANKRKLSKKILDFKPDLFITFNNVLPYRELIDELDCPVACFAADSCAFFSNQDLIKKHLEKYYFFNFSNDTIAPFYERYPFVAKDRIILFGHVSDLRAVDMPQDINISFIGSIATWNKDFPNYFKALYNDKNVYDTEYDLNQVKDKFFAELDRFEKNPLSHFDCDLPEYQSHILPPDQAAILLLTGKMRFDILNKMTDLGLKIFGVPSVYADTIIYNYDLFRCFDYSTNATMEHATFNYNRSKISLNLPHAHTKEGLSWRVCDILASNAVLLSSRQPDLVKLLNGYCDLPMYESPAEARDLAIKLLGDDTWRKDLAAACQQMIDDKCRFEHKFKIMEDVIPGLSLFSSNAGFVEFLDEASFLRMERYYGLMLLKLLRDRREKTSLRHSSSLTARTKRFILEKLSG